MYSRVSSFYHSYPNRPIVADQHGIYPSVPQNNSSHNSIFSNRLGRTAVDGPQHIGGSFSRTSIDSYAYDAPIHKTDAPQPNKYDSAYWSETSECMLNYEQKRSFEYNSFDHKKSNINTSKSSYLEREWSWKLGYKRRETWNSVKEREKQPRNHSNERKRIRNLSHEKMQSSDLSQKMQSSNLRHDKTQSSNLRHDKTQSSNLRHDKIQSSYLSHKKMQSNNLSCEKRKSINLSHEKRKSNNISHVKRKPSNLSHEKRKSSNLSHDERKSSNLSHEERKSSSLSHEKKKSSNLSHEKRESSNLSHEKRKSSNPNCELKSSKGGSPKLRKSKNAGNEIYKLEPPREKKILSKNDKRSADFVKNEFGKSRSVRNESVQMKATTHRKNESAKCTNSRAETVESKVICAENRLINSQKENIGEFKLPTKKRHCSHHDQSRNIGSACKALNDDSSSDIQIESSRYANAKGTDVNRHKTSMQKTSTSKYTWIRSSPANLYYVRDKKIPTVMKASQKLKDLHQMFKFQLVKRAERVRLSKPKYEPPPRKSKLHKHKVMDKSGESSSTSEGEDTFLYELERRKNHPYRLHKELWYNDPGEMNDEPLCKCNAKARRSGICHDIYAEESSTALCDQYSNNADKLHHYRILVTPTTNILSNTPTVIHHDDHDFIFEGFSILSHYEIPKLPPCRFTRCDIEFSIFYVKEEYPENFTVAGLELFRQFLFTELLELVDLNLKAYGDYNGCNRFHILPRFSRNIENNGKELLSLHVIFLYLLESNQSLIENRNLSHVMSLSKHKWEALANSVKGMIVTCPGMKPSSIRIDQLDRNLCDLKRNIYPQIVHFSLRPLHVSYFEIPAYKKLWRNYVKFHHLLGNKPTITPTDREKLRDYHDKLKKYRMDNNCRKNVTVIINSENFFKTGIMCDIVHDAMMLPVLIWHLRFHQSLNILEDRIDYKFKDRSLLQLALTHSNYKANFGTNRDHAKNSLTNCSIRQTLSDNQQLYCRRRPKHGINILMNIMSSLGNEKETNSSIDNNERLEFLGDAVIELLSTVHLFFIFYDQSEGFLTEYRTEIIQNRQLAVLAKNLHLQDFMLNTNGPHLCDGHYFERAIGNCFEALVGALFLDGGIDIADHVFGKMLFPKPEDFDLWANYPPHRLQEEGDGRKWISVTPVLQKLKKFEEATGIEFTHIRLLAKSMMHQGMGYNYLTEGSNQRLELLGDAVLQLIVSEYLYKRFLGHREGHLTLLRAALVNNRFLADICDELGMVEYAIYPRFKTKVYIKDKADLLEAFLGALYVDKDLGYCAKFCEVCFFPRLETLIKNQNWNDSKSKLQQYYLKRRAMNSTDPDIPIYKLIEFKGPTHSRIFVVAVYFRGKRLAVGSALNIKQAEMLAAQNALNDLEEFSGLPKALIGKKSGVAKLEE